VWWYDSGCVVCRNVAKLLSLQYTSQTLYLLWDADQDRTSSQWSGGVYIRMSTAQ